MHVTITRYQVAQVTRLRSRRSIDSFGDIERCRRWQVVVAQMMMVMMRFSRSLISQHPSIRSRTLEHVAFILLSSENVEKIANALGGIAHVALQIEQAIVEGSAILVTHLRSRFDASDEDDLTVF